MLDKIQTQKIDHFICDWQEAKIEEFLDEYLDDNPGDPRAEAICDGFESLEVFIKEENTKRIKAAIEILEELQSTFD